MMREILIISSSLYLISILLNGLGIHLLTVVRPLTNSKFLLTNLAITGLLLSGIQIAFILYEAFSGLYSPILLGLLGTIWLARHSSVFFLTIDRLIAIQFPLRYRVLITKKRLKIAILAAWILAIALGTVMGISHFHEMKWLYSFWNYMWIFIDVVFIFSAVTTYGLIFNKILRRRRFQNNEQDGRRRQFIMSREKKFIKIAGLIIGSFMVLVLIPDMIYDLAPYSQVFKAFIHISWPTGVIMDPVIYIFLQDDLRSLLKRRVLQMNCNADHIPNDADHTQQDTAL